MNTIFNDNTYFEYLRDFNYALKQAAKADAILKHLTFRGVPEGTVIFSSPKKHYTTASGIEKEYIYTNAYLYIGGKKYYISKKILYPQRNDGRDLNNFEDPTTHLFLLARFWMRRMAKELLKFCLNYAKSLVKMLNSIKSRDLARINFDDYKNDFFENFHKSEENQKLAYIIDDFFDLPPEKQLQQLDFRPSIDSKDIENFSARITDIEENYNKHKTNTAVYATKKAKTHKKRKNFWYKLRKKKKVDKGESFFDGNFSDLEQAEYSEKYRKNLKYCFDNSIINDCGEQVRSKNEVIALRCAHDCGLSYELEPYYPGTFWRADLLLHARGKNIYVEIAGSRDDPEYEKNLKNKIEFAKELGIMLVVIDMTAYPDKKGKNIMRMNYQTLCRIFMYIQLGILKQGIVLPY